jgi:hypothetical protein
LGTGLGIAIKNVCANVDNGASTPEATPKRPSYGNFYNIPKAHYPEECR